MVTEDFALWFEQSINRPLHYFETLPGLYTSTALYITILATTYTYVKHRSAPAIYKILLLWNSRLYALFCAVYLLALLHILPFEATSFNDSTLRKTYHYTKLYEYIDIPLVLLTSSPPPSSATPLSLSTQPIDIHFLFHHLTTPYYTYIRVLPQLPVSDGWKLFAALNKVHHALMYAYFGRVLPWGDRESVWVLRRTGCVQHVVGMVGEGWLLYSRRGDNEEEEVWRNWLALGWMGVLLVLFLRDNRRRDREAGGVRTGKKRRD